MVKYTETSSESKYDGSVVCTFKWTVHDLLSIKDEVLNSPTFSAGDCNDTEWYIKFYPNGRETDPEALSINLYLFSSRKPEVNVDFTIALLNDKGDLSEHKNKATVCCFQKGGNAQGWGWNVAKKPAIIKEAERYLPDGNLTIFCEITLEGGPISQSDRTRFKKRSENLGEMLTSQKFSDVSLIVGSKEIKAYKGLLACMSPVFAEMFDKHKRNSFVIADIDYEVMVEVLKFIYTGQTDKLIEKAQDLLVAADKYALIDLKELCEDALCEQLTVENACEILVLLDKLCCNRSKQKVKKFISENVTAVMKTKGFTQMTQLHLIRMILKTVATIKNN